MSIHLSLNEALRERRQALGASVRQVAAWADLDPSRLREIEAGAAISSWELDTVCRALAVDSGALARGTDRTPKRSVARFKAASWIDPTPEDLRTLSLAAELGRIGDFLAKGVDQPVRLEELRSPQPVHDRADPWLQGYRLGEQARRVLAPAPGPIRNLETLLTDWGAHVGRVEFSSADLDAASLWERDSLPIILLNKRSIRSRSSLSRRALLAHELCHLLHESGENDLLTQLSWSEGKANYSEAIEQRARAFAPAFLAPRDEVQHWFRAGDGRRAHGAEAKVRMLAERWGFSVHGAIWHAKNCAIIQARTAAELNRRAPTEDHAWSDRFEDGASFDRASDARETVDISRGLLSHLVAEAATASVISEGRAQEILTWR